MEDKTLLKVFVCAHFLIVTPVHHPTYNSPNHFSQFLAGWPKQLVFGEFLEQVWLHLQANLRTIFLNFAWSSWCLWTESSILQDWPMAKLQDGLQLLQSVESEEWSIWYYKTQFIKREHKYQNDLVSGNFLKSTACPALGCPKLSIIDPLLG